MLKDGTYFPFERMYIVPEKFLENDYWKSVFPYMLVVESPEVVLKILNGLAVKERWEISSKEGVKGVPHSEYSPSFGKYLPDMSHKRIVIPTYKYKAKPGYLWSYLKKARLSGLELALYTPEGITPSICYRCLNLTHKYAGECHPSSDKCRELVSLDFSKPKEESECQADSPEAPSQD